MVSAFFSCVVWRAGATLSFIANHTVQATDPMRILRRLLVAAALCAASTSTYGQLTLLQGDTYTYEFNRFVFQSVHPITVIPGRPTYYGQFAVYFDASTFPTFQPGDLLRYEMFENSLAEIPICTDTLSLPFPPISPR